MNFTTNVVLINCETCGGDARYALEAIENEDFGGYDHLTRHLANQFDIHPSSVTMYTLSEFMDSFNDSDDDADFIGLNKNIMGYIRTPKNEEN